MVKYEHKHGLILKDGHTMFLEDAVKDLNNYAQKKVEAPETIDNTERDVISLLEHALIDLPVSDNHSDYSSTERWIKEALAILSPIS